MTLHSVPTAPAPQTEFLTFWNEVLAPKFVKYRHVLEGGLSRHSAAVMPRIGFRDGARVMDLGCGFGDTAAMIAREVGLSGSVLGIDCCEAFLDIARRRPETMFLPNLKFACADAEHYLGEGEFDMVYSRFGTMFFANPVAGLRNIRKSLKPGGRFAQITWRKKADNPWLNEATKVVQSFLPEPDGTGDSCGPGPFSFSDQDQVTAMMTSAGFTDIAFERIDTQVMVGRDTEDAVCFQLAIGPAGEAYRQAGAAGVAQRAKIAYALGELFDGVQASRGGLWMDSSSWLITATTPA